MTSEKYLHKFALSCVSVAGIRAGISPGVVRVLAALEDAKL